MSLPDVHFRTRLPKHRGFRDPYFLALLALSLASCAVLIAVVQVALQ